MVSLVSIAKKPQKQEVHGNPGQALTAPTATSVP